MNEHATFRREKIAPRASVLIESMRDLGYSLQTAVADVIDNAITAGASEIEILADTHSEMPAIAILDNGHGMNEQELLEAMRPGTRSPLDDRTATDLGRFGLGLKTASFSQCRRLSVVSRRDGVTSCAIWDLDNVARSDEWYVEVPSAISSIPWIEQLGDEGTLVIWQKLDRLVERHSDDERRNLVRQINAAASHIELVFHRFLAGEPGIKAIEMRLNGRKLEPYDPFNSRNPATQFGEKETFLLGGHKIMIQPVTLPHHKKVSLAEWTKFAGEEGYVKNQGFYLYRSRRLIIHGTWFGLARQTELTKLSRVRVDMPNGLDSEWKIDVKKASAQPPGPVRERLRRLIDQIGAASKRTYTARGARLVTDNRLPLWTRRQDGNRISYGLSTEHPVIAGFLARLDPTMSGEFRKIVDLVIATLPIDALVADIGSSPENMAAPEMEAGIFKDIVQSTYRSLRRSGVSVEEAELMMSSAPPYSASWAEAKRLIEAIEQENNSA